MASNTRRAVLGGGLTVGAAAVASTGAARAARYDVAVVGAGVFGAWTAFKLLKRGRRVLLIDAWGPAHARASSGGESRMTRAGYGSSEIYTRWATDSLAEWKWLSGRTELPLFHHLGVLFFFQKDEAYIRDSLEVHRRLKLPLEALSRAEMARRWPQMTWDGVEGGLYEPAFGALMARRSVQTLTRMFVEAGGEYLQAAVAPPTITPQLSALTTSAGPVTADQYVFACGPWLPKLFPAALGGRIFPTRQEIFFFAPEAGDTRFNPGQLPGWADFNGGDIYYGFPNLEARGFKIAHDAHGPRMDPDGGDRTPSAGALEDVRAFMRQRFPALADRPLSESRVCQYENSSNGDFLIDRHPVAANVLLVGAGSGHGFKHGPAVGAAAAAMVLDPTRKTQAEFTLATKALSENRAVH